MFMIPTNNGSTTPCSNISSNCVIWQGPDLPCIDICNGDSVSEVIAKLAEELCKIIDSVAGEPDLSGLDLKCVLPGGEEAPIKLSDTLQLIVNKICATTSNPAYVLPTIDLPSCLYYTVGVQQITALRLDLYAAYLAGKICDILDTINLINVTINNHETRLITLENCVLTDGSCTPAGGGGSGSLISQCINPGLSMAVTALLSEVESKLCNLETAVGSPALIGLAINQSCITGSTGMLSSSATYGSAGSWVNNPSTLAQSHGNLWAIVCDMYAAIESIQTTCCGGGCDDITFAYSVSLNVDTSGNASSISFNFSGCNIPPAYSDCNGFTTLTITDGVGGTTSTTTDISIAQNGTPVVVSLGTLNKFQGFTTQVAFCATDGTNQCSDSISKTLSSPSNCPSDISVTAITADTATVSFSNALGTTATYSLYVMTVSQPQTIAYTEVRNSPGTSVIFNATGLSAETNYVVKLVINLNGFTTYCDDVPFETAEAEVPQVCNQYRVQGIPNESTTFQYVNCDGFPDQTILFTGQPDVIPVITICARSYTPVSGVIVTLEQICQP